MNPVATGALLAIAFAQFVQVAILWDASPQEIHFRAAQEFCKENPYGYFECMARLTK